MASVRVEAPAKVNLFLRVLAREEGGYHQIETLYAAVDLADRISVEPGGSEVTLAVEGADLGPPQENLAYRAARGFLERVGGTGARIELEKRIPARAGLGGGSSDAAAVLRALNRLHGDPLEIRELMELGAALGADVPFFLSPTTLALAWGRGDRLLALPPLPSRPILLVLPDEGVGTAEAYAELAEARRRHRGGSARVGRSRLLAPGELGSWEGVAALAENDFHRTVFRDRPDLKRAHRALQDTEPLLALLSGSGSALFAVFPGEEEARRARDVVVDEMVGGRALLARTLETPAA